MKSVFKAISKSVNASTSSSNSGNSTSTEEVSINSGDSSSNHKIDKQGKKSNSNHNTRNRTKKTQQNEVIGMGNKPISNNHDDNVNGHHTRGEINSGNDNGKSPTTVTYLKAEYRILNITTNLKEMTEKYEYTPTPFDPLQSPPSLDTNSSCHHDYHLYATSPSIVPMSTNSLNQETWSEREGEGIEDDNDQIRRKIEEEMYKQLCGLYDIIKVESMLEQYVLRELRHLQEYLCHKYPPIMAYLRVPFEEVIECARGKTKGLYISCPDPKNRPVSIQRLSAPSPMKIAPPSRSSSGPSSQSTSSTTTTISNNSRGTNRERSIVSTSSSISSMPSKKQNKSNTIDDLSTSSASGPDSSCEDDNDNCYYGEI